VDLGSKRVGLALTDPLAMIASPYGTIPFSSMETLAKRIAHLCTEKLIELVIIGLPVRDDGREGEGCERSRVFQSKLKSRGIACVLWDESWSSRDAEQILKTLGKTRRTAKEKVDAIAASLFLRDYLQSEESRAGPTPSSASSAEPPSTS
jgi:putative Holliday junction resolvase